VVSSITSVVHNAMQRKSRQRKSLRQAIRIVLHFSASADGLPAEFRYGALRWRNDGNHALFRKLLWKHR